METEANQSAETGVSDGSEAEGDRPHSNESRRSSRRRRLAASSRRAFVYLAVTTFSVAVVSGILVRILDEGEFNSVGDGIWWAIVTISTVGYGDIVPTSGWGRLIGSLVLVFGVTFVAFLTATVTSLFVADTQEDIDASSEAKRSAEHGRTVALLEGLSKRLDSIENKLDQDLAAKDEE